MAAKKTAAINKKTSVSAKKKTSGNNNTDAQPDNEKSNGSAAASGNQQRGNSALPMFYNSVALLNSETHGKLHLRKASSLEFAKSANSIVLAASEFSEAAMHYPIVFGRGDGNLNAFAITGHTNGQNLFVDDKNQWRAGVYIPAYVRRYPFVLVESVDKKTLSLAVDLESEMLSDKGGMALYEDGKPSEIAQKALEFCSSYQQEMKISETIFAAIDASGILVERNAQVTLPDDKKVTITGFSIVDEKALVALDDDEFLKLRKTGALNLIYCQLWSMRAWKKLLD